MRITSRLCFAIGLSLCVATTASIVLFGHLGTVRTAFADGFFGPFLPLQVSTVPSNGDTTSYGLALFRKVFPRVLPFRKAHFSFRISTVVRLPDRAPRSSLSSQLPSAERIAFLSVGVAIHFSYQTFVST